MESVRTVSLDSDSMSVSFVEIVRAGVHPLSLLKNEATAFACSDRYVDVEQREVVKSEPKGKLLCIKTNLLSNDRYSIPAFRRKMMLQFLMCKMKAKD